MRELLEEIVAGKFEPGEMLPREQDLAERWTISRGIARETIRALEERGVLTVKHGRGATVAPPQRWNVLDPEVLRALLEGPNAQRLIADLLEARKALEVEAARLAAERRTDDQLAAMSNTLDTLRAATSATARASAEVAFHRALVDATENRPMIGMIGPLLDAMDTMARVVGAGPGSTAEHERILTAVRRRQATAAANATAKHLDAVATRHQRR
jgi:DNA-binding FadR family transcriptional regulator